MITAKLTNPINGASVRVIATTDSCASSYGREVWVDADGTPYCEVDAPGLYEITEIEEEED